jgi:hypothetical protein
MNWKIGLCERKRCCSVLQWAKYRNVYLALPRKTMKTCQDNWSLIRDCNPGPPGVLTTRPQQCCSLHTYIYIHIYTYVRTYINRLRTYTSIRTFVQT